MAQKNSFVLQSRMGAVVNKLSDKQAGALFKAIFNYAENGVAAGFEDGMVDVVFAMFKQDIDYNADKYAETCKRNAANGKLGGRPKNEKTERLLKKPSGYYQKHNDNDVVVDVDNDVDRLQLLTADKSAEQAEKSSKPRKLNNLQEFSNRVIEHFEDLKTDDQKAIWFKRNCRCLSDILKFCGGDIDVAVECIAVCVERLEKAGLKGGYEAVCRNITLYYDEALKRVAEWRKAKDEN